MSSFWNSLCSCSRPTKISAADEDYFRHEEQLNYNLNSYDMERVQVQGDGNCIFYALAYGLIHRMKTERNGFGYSVQRFFPLSPDLHYKAFADRLRRLCVDQWKTKPQFYAQFVDTNRIPFDKEVQRFSHNGVCDSALGDIVPLTVANALNVHIIIFTSVARLSRVDVRPMKGHTTAAIPPTTIFLAYNQHNIGHYDAAYPRY